MDFFKYRGLPHGTHVMDVGCGWGLAGIYCAKRHNAVVTCVDIDSEVFPYLRLHAEMNDVEIVTVKKGFEELKDKHLKNVDVMIGADICFYDAMIDPLKRLIDRAMIAGVKLVLIADPGRPTFGEVVKYFIRKRSGEMMYRAVQSPYRIQGQILKISSFTE
jgi:predicted nicotinamide N-methyase